VGNMEQKWSREAREQTNNPAWGPSNHRLSSPISHKANTTEA
jgi:hypothetical protein